LGVTSWLDEFKTRLLRVWLKTIHPRRTRNNPWIKTDSLHKALIVKNDFSICKINRKPKNKRKSVLFQYVN
jgi:hypothetical protein